MEPTTSTGFSGSALLLLLLAAGPLSWVSSAPAPLDFSGEYTEDDTPRSIPTALNSKAVELARHIYNEARRLQEEVCRESGICEDSMELLIEIQLHLPRMVPEDRCFFYSKPFPFHKEKCLHKIYSDLQVFKAYFAYLEGTIASEEKRVAIRHITHRVTILTELLMTKTAVNKNKIDMSVTDLQSKDPWVKNRNTHRILRSFIKLMETTVRAVRYIGNKHQA